MINKFNTNTYIKNASLLLIILISIIIFWGYYAPLNTLAVSSGKVIVSGQNKPIQYLNSGIVKNIFVKNGDLVNKNDILIKLDDTQLKSQYKILFQDLNELKIKRDRLKAQKENSTNIIYNKDVYSIKSRNIKVFKEIQNDILISKIQLLQSQTKIINKKISGLKEQILGINQSIKSKKLYIKSLQKELDELQSLYNEKLIDKIQLRDLKRKKILRDNELSELFIQKSSLKVNVAQNEEEILKIKKEFITKTLDELKDTLSKIRTTQQNFIATKDKLNKTAIISPIDGIVDSLQIFSNGAVLSSGQIIMEIVPKNNKLIIQANLSITDIDTVKVGQNADITFSAFKTKMTFSINGIVKYISADRKIDKATNVPFYQVNIEITKNGFEQIKKNNFKLIIGMPVDIMIKTGSRTMLSYIIKPFLDMKLRSFNEE